uniref:Secreted protein n=1 Tax=Trichuris muris TaxID=70415 RepID=A0A5S6Q3V7_TRIMR
MNIRELYGFLNSRFLLVSTAFAAEKNGAVWTVTDKTSSFALSYSEVNQTRCQTVNKHFVRTQSFRCQRVV